ncbi:hypothetical protein F5X99DRAFT_413544 [Biscogniauxia marginata]|nr:hypothetical protein F5X99DRAFT_413544 [Biscogniauxia marginata]
MHLVTLLVSIAAIAIASAVAAPTATLERTDAAAVADPAVAARSTPDCKALKEYCTNCQDFQCETNPGCEWCYEHDAFGP